MPETSSDTSTRSVNVDAWTVDHKSFWYGKFFMWHKHPARELGASQSPADMPMRFQCREAGYRIQTLFKLRQWIRPKHNARLSHPQTLKDIPSYAGDGVGEGLRLRQLQHTAPTGEGHRLIEA